MDRTTIDTQFHRQLDIIHPDKLAFPITIIGAGASGSCTTLALAKMGCSDITVYDHDKVEAHNAPNQIYGPLHLGESKAQSLRDEIARLSGVAITARWERYTNQDPGKLTIACVDDMDARVAIWEQAQAQGTRRKPVQVIDPRQGGEFIVIHTAKSHGDVISVKAYEETLHPVEESMQLPCTARSIVYNSMLTGALVAILVRKHALGELLRGNS